MQLIISALKKLEGKIGNPQIAFSVGHGSVFKCIISGQYQGRLTVVHNITSLRNSDILKSQYRINYMELLLNTTMDEVINFIDKKELQREGNPREEGI